MKKFLLAGAILALTMSSAWAMPRAALPAMPQAVPTAGWLDGIFGCPTSWYMVYVWPGSGCHFGGGIRWY